LCRQKSKLSLLIVVFLTGASQFDEGFGLVAIAVFSQSKEVNVVNWTRLRAAFLQESFPEPAGEDDSHNNG